MSTTNKAACSDGETAHIVLDFLGDNLEPSQLIALIPLRPLGPKRKGEPLGRTRGPTQPVAKIGYCGFTTHDQDRLATSNAHLGFLLDIVEPRLEAMRRVMSEQSLRWTVTFFEGDHPGQYLADLDQELLQRAAHLDLPIYREREAPPSIPR
jgi:hypothetical protein